MSQFALHNARVILEDRIQPGGVLIRDGLIALVFGAQEMPVGLSANETLDLQGKYLAPGMIDIHIHGSAGVDVQKTDAAGLDKLSRFLLSEGVTGYFATFVPDDESGYRKSVAEIASYTGRRNENSLSGRPELGAEILGIHFEGPFVSEQRCGALHREHFRTFDGDIRALDVFIGAPESALRLMTLAPEIPGGLDLTRELTRNGVRVFIGHSQAAPELLDQAFEAGARHITHFPNALEPLHHRKPGAVGWGLLRDDVSVDCIADLHHVDPLMLKLIYQAKRSNRMALISDAIMPAGLGDGDYSVWGDAITVRNGRTSLGGHAGEGTIAGSVITMRAALKNIVDIGIPLPEAVLMSSAAPAGIVGLESEVGAIKKGMRADLVAFDDQFEINFAAVRGSVVRFDS